MVYCTLENIVPPGDEHFKYSPDEFVSAWRFDYLQNYCSVPHAGRKHTPDPQGLFPIECLSAKKSATNMFDFLTENARDFCNQTVIGLATNTPKCRSQAQGRHYRY